MSNLAVTLPNQTFIAGSGISGVPTPQTSGVPFSLTRLTAVDRYLNIATNYRGAKSISYVGPGGSPAYTTNVSFTNGYSATLLTTTLRKAETTTIKASDGVATGLESSPLTVHHAGVAKLQLLLPGEAEAPGTLTGKTGVPSVQTAGVAFPVLVRAVDDNWNLVNSVTDRVDIKAGDANASLPAPAPLSGGTGTFNLVLFTPGARTITASNLTTLSVQACTSSPLSIAAASFQRLQLLVPGEEAAPGTMSGKTGVPTAHAAGSSFTVTVNAVDAFWNVVAASDFVDITSSDANALLPAPAALTNGTRSFPVTLDRVGSSTLTATDLSDGAITNDTSPLIPVTAGSFTKLQLLVPGEEAAPGTSTGKTGVPLPHGAGLPFPVTVNAVDDAWNPVGTVTDLVHFTSSDTLATLPADGALDAGTKVFTVTLGTVGLQTLTASDASDGTKGESTSPAMGVGIAKILPAEGGADVSADTAGGAYTSLNGPAIAEGTCGNVGTGTIMLTAPPGFVLNTGNMVRVTVTGTGVGSDVVLASATATVSATTILVTVNSPSSGSRLSTLTWSGIQVRPSAGAPLASGPIVISGTATIAGIPAGSDCGTVSEVAGLPARLTLQTQPSATATAGVAFVRQPVIRIEDQFGNLRREDNSTVVTAAVGSGLGALQGSVSSVAVNGVVTFTDLVHRVAGVITLGFSAPGLTGTVSEVIGVSPASASRLAFVQPPTDVIAGATMTPPVTVQVRDAFSNDVSGAGIRVVVFLGSGTGGLGGTSSNLTDGSGLAAFENLSFDRSGLKTLTASALGLTSSSSDAFAISPAAAHQLVFIQPPTNAVAGATITPAVTVQVQDALGNPIPHAGRPVSLSLSTGTGTLEGTTPQVTDPNGVAVFGDVSLAAAGEKSLTAASTGLTSAASGPFVISPSDYARVQVLVPGETAAPGTATGKTGVPTPLLQGAAFPARVNAVDACWNLVSTVSNTVGLYSSDTSATLPDNAAFEQGTHLFLVTFNTEGSQTLSAEDLSDMTVPDDTSPAIQVARTLFALEVVSAHGTASPIAGLHPYALGTVLTNSVTSPDTQGTTEYACKGWMMTGHAPSHGTSNSLVMTVTNDSVLTWLWTTNYLFQATAGAYGAVSGATNGWHALGDGVTVTGVPNVYHRFLSWTGDVPPTLTHSNPCSLTMNQARSIVAVFAESVGPTHGTPYTWLAHYGFTNEMEAAEMLTGSNGVPVWQSYIADLDPTNTASLLRLRISCDPTTTATVSWESSTNCVYGLECSSALSLSNGWITVPGQSGVWGTGGTQSFSDGYSTSGRSYRIRAQRSQ